MDARLADRRLSGRPGRRDAASLRRLLGASALGAAFLGLPVHAAAIGALLPPLRLELVDQLPARPVAIVHGGDERLFLGLQDGRVLVWSPTDGLAPAPFLDLRGVVVHDAIRGLLGLALHPRFPQTPWLYALTSRQGAVRLARYSLGPDGTADAATEAVLLDIPKVNPQHSGGQLAFGPDGLLYVGSGDSGGAYDMLCVAQRPDSLEGKILRLDVDAGAEEPPYHAIPPGNPWAAGGPGRPEVWALGLRNPWRFAFDPREGNLWIADVGQDSREEIDVFPRGEGAGANLGWNAMEGTSCTGRTGGCATPPPPCGDPLYTAPLLEYEHADGRCSVIGGPVYRGTRLPGLAGTYLFGDFCTGELWGAREEQPGAWEALPLRLALPFFATFGVDAAGEVYLGGHDGLYRLVADFPACAPDATTLCLADGRFRVRTSWAVPPSAPRAAGAAHLTADTGTFWFFDPANVEILVKVLDACDTPWQRLWVFAAGLTNVDVVLTAEDTATGATWEHRHAGGTAFPPVLDTDAFATCAQ